ncbi:unnamed protein product [Cylindrotheca closterium]|uniref:Uncharacterized protein n=1 Tax=Cylindrotheca closterium TaxID=2856 RepID=A0AAD2CS35_9STRA|nr:unnamed protein product [Cylindrotheca closterium]
MIHRSYISIAQVASFLSTTLAFLLPCISYALSSRQHTIRNFQVAASNRIPFSRRQQCPITSRPPQRIASKRSRLLAADSDEPVTANSYESSSNAIPIDGSMWPDRFPAQDHCSRCGLCETSFVSKVTDACAFLGEGMARMDSMEPKVHGRSRVLDDLAWSSSADYSSSIKDEGRFGVLQEPIQLAKGTETQAQWTGCVTGIALAMLESNMVDAVVCIASQNDDSSASSWAVPEPILARTSEEVLRGRGVKPALAPSLKVLDQIKNDSTIQKLLFCGVGCAVQAFRAIQDDLKLKEVYVLGTNCADNSPTPEAANNFIEQGLSVKSESVLGYEFMQDFKVHVKTTDSYVTKPYFSLPGTIAEPSIAKSCLACFDYTNGLADVVVGYMGAPLDSNSRMDESFQTIAIRNERGVQMVQTAVKASRLKLHGTAPGKGGHESLSSATVAADSIVLSMVGEKDPPEQGMPALMGEIMAFAMRNLGPKGINFARYSVDYHLLRNYLHILNEWGEARTTMALPASAKEIVEHYLQTDSSFQEIVTKIRAKAKR